MIDFFEFSNEMLCLADQRGQFVRVNHAWTKTLGWSAEELTSRPYLDFVHPDDLERTRQEASLLRSADHQTVRFENRYRCRDGTYRWLAWHAALEQSSGQIVAAARDVTIQKEQTEALRQSEERFRTLVAKAPYGIAQADAEGSIFYANERWCEMSGATIEEALGFGWRTFIHPDDFDRLMVTWTQALESGEDMPRTEFRFVHKNGAVRWASAVVTMMHDVRGRVTRQIGMLEDITEQKAASDALLAEQQLLRESLEGREKERQLLAFDIHDGLMQYMIGALLHFQGCQQEMNDPDDAERLEPGLKALRKAVTEGRRIMNGVRMDVLDQFGIVKALEELAAESTSGKIAVEFARPEQEIERLAPETEIALYRIAQEAITNAVKHSGSSRVLLTLRPAGERIAMEVRDWGVGLKPTASRGVHGLPGIRERVKLLDGRVCIDTPSDGGTRIRVELSARPARTVDSRQ